MVHALRKGPGIVALLRLAAPVPETKPITPIRGFDPFSIARATSRQSERRFVFHMAIYANHDVRQSRSLLETIAFAHCVFAQHGRSRP